MRIPERKGALDHPRSPHSPAHRFTRSEREVSRPAPPARPMPPPIAPNCAPAPSEHPLGPAIRSARDRPPATPSPTPRSYGRDVGAPLRGRVRSPPRSPASKSDPLHPHSRRGHLVGRGESRRPKHLENRGIRRFEFSSQACRLLGASRLRRLASRSFGFGHARGLVRRFDSRRQKNAAGLDLSRCSFSFPDNLLLLKGKMPPPSDKPVVSKGPITGLSAHVCASLAADFARSDSSATSKARSTTRHSRRPRSSRSSIKTIAASISESRAR